MAMRRLLVFLLCLLGLPAMLAGASYVLVFHGGSQTMSIYNGDTMALAGAPTVGGGATRAFGVIDPNSPTQFLKFYVITPTAVVVLNPIPPFSVRATLSLGAAVPAGPNTSALSPDGRRLLVAAGNQVHVINTTDPNDAIAVSLVFGSSPSGIAVAPNSRRAYVASSDSSTIRIIDLSFNPGQLLSLTASLPSGALPTAIGVSPNGSRVYVAVPGAVYEVERVGNNVSPAIPNVSIGGSSIVFDPDPPVGFAVVNAGGQAAILNLITRSFNPTPFVAGGTGIAEVVTPGGNRAFLIAGSPAKLYSGFVTAGAGVSEVINPQTGLAYGTGAVDIENSVDGRFVFVAFAAESRLVRFDPSGAATPTLVTTALPPSAISLASTPSTQATLLDTYGGNNQSGVAGSFFPSPLAVRARSGGLGAFNQNVFFTSGSGVTFSDSNVTTNLLGVAETLVSVPTSSPVEVTATTVSAGITFTQSFSLNGGGTPTSGDGLIKVSGDRQMTSSGSAFPLPFVVRASNGGIPLPSITLNITASSALVGCPTTVVTDAAGEAPITCFAAVTAILATGELNVSDAFGRALAVPFRVTVVVAASDLPAILNVESDANLIATVRQTIPDAIRVRALRADALTGVGEVGVSFSSQQDVIFNPATAVTTSGGAASTSVTFGCSVGGGAIRVALLAPGQPSNLIRLTTTRGPAAVMLKRQGDNQSGRPDQLLSGPGQALLVNITDGCNNGVPDAPIAWRVQPEGAATLELTSRTTDFDGRASTLVRLGNRPGPFTVTAVSGNLSAVFNVTVNIVATRLALISGNNQNVVLGQSAGQPLVVEVLDDFGNTVPGVEVNFRVTGGAATVSAARLTSNAQGRAATTVQAGLTLGAITVVAEAAGRSVTFTLLTLGRLPVVSSLGFVNGASFRAGWVSGSAGTIFGTGLMEAITGAVLADRAPFPTSLRGVRVVVEGIDCPIIALINIGGQEQINIQVPFGLAVGLVTVVIHNNGSSTTFTGVRIMAVQPGIFEFEASGVRLAAALHADFSVVTPGNPARPGEVILLFLTGLGLTIPAGATNVAGPAPPAATVTRPVVGINGEGVEVLGSFYAPLLYTAYQVNFVMSRNARSGLATISVVADGVGSQDARIPIQ